jgi:hypothetical protein
VELLKVKALSASLSSKKKKKKQKKKVMSVVNVGPKDWF